MIRLLWRRRPELSPHVDQKVLADIEVDRCGVPHRLNTRTLKALHDFEQWGFAGIDGQIAEGWRRAQIGCQRIAADTTVGGCATHVAPVEIVLEGTYSRLNLETERPASAQT